MDRLRSFTIVAVAAAALAACGPSTPSPGPGPVAAECTPEQCGPQPAMPTAEWPDGTMSGPTGKCVKAADGSCGWEINECESAPCVRGGCSGQLCVEQGADGIVTTCQWQPEFACYQAAACERQSDGQCGFTQTDELNACLASPPPPPEGGAPQ